MATLLETLTTAGRQLLARPSEHVGLDALLARADPKEPFSERLHWLARVCRWVASSRRLRADPESISAAPGGVLGARSPQSTRLLFLLSVLERHPESKARVARTLRATLREVDALELYCESGLPRELGLWTEALERVLSRFLPTNPYRSDLGSVLLALFPSEQDAEWIERVPQDILERLHALVSHGASPDEADWDALVHDVPDALLVLVSSLRATGLSTTIRKRLDKAPFRELPFFGLTEDAECTLAAWRVQDAAALGEAASLLMERLSRCRATLGQVHAHLDEFGVSIKVVYHVELMEALIRRIQALLELMSLGGLASQRTQFLARLVRDNLGQRRIRSLVGDNLHRLARRMVDRSAKTGEHYITRTRAEYREMVRSAMGGGALTAVTTWVKLVVPLLHAPPFVEGVLASLNYAVSFVVIQLAHFTLATKQPAMTGPALAAKMHKVETEAGLRALIDEIVHLSRSQAAGILGNVGAVVPAVLLTAGLAHWTSGAPPLGVEKASYAVSSLSLFGPTPFFAAFTGVLLWLSSLFAGWADNWFALRGLRDSLAGSPRLRLVLGPGRAARAARWLSDNMSGLAGNVSLGFLLGLTPVVARFLGLPADVRHVTLAAGQLAAAAVSLGPGLLREASFWLAVSGIAVVGVLNVGVSFGLALYLAVRARGVEDQRSAICRELTRRFREAPLSFLFPR